MVTVCQVKGVYAGAGVYAGPGVYAGTAKAIEGKNAGPRRSPSTGKNTTRDTPLEEQKRFFMMSLLYSIRRWGFPADDSSFSWKSHIRRPAY
jgi:hypothetical protein